jgi:hypothetical protein
LTKQPQFVFGGNRIEAIKIIETALIKQAHLVIVPGPGGAFSSPLFGNAAVAPEPGFSALVFTPA